MKSSFFTVRNSNKLGSYDAHFLLKLSTLMNSGFTMYNALKFLLEQYDVLKQGTKEEAGRMIDEGEKLSEILKVLGFGKSIIMQIAFAEIHGEMINNLKESSLYLENRRATVSKLIKAVQYPVVLISIFIVMLVVLNYTVIPQFQSLYISVGAEADGVVSILTLLLEILPGAVMVLLTGVGAIAFLIYVIIKYTPVESQLKVLLKFPLVKFYVVNYHTYRFSREFGYFINNGLEVKEIITLFKNQSLSVHLSYIASLIENDLNRGDSLSAAVSHIPALDDKLATFISHGELNSEVGKELIIFSEYTLEKIIMKIENLTKRIQPVIFTVLGVLIVCLYLVIVLPIFQMMSVVG
ncbi:competence type IV pilus assembly protein ComGB [Salinicoccus kekensis]|uniref:Type II secretion system protein F (GspF) n=1 Tax=Salinicoccus kekensis TaxID=714307 RepID=A0A285UDN4_9STAP|nr:competence type IV pilus assembly protein ComGB [Salinicoccus kekensis]SOC38696.1 type II secretion system protein F (GspF) [Salinicoccus kekensis]